MLRAFRPLTLSRGMSQMAQQYNSLPQPSSQVPDVKTFLQKIGRNCQQYEKHFESWESLMKPDSAKLKEAGVDTRDRRYILTWVERFKQGRPLTEHSRGRKKWGGERNMKTNRAVFYGRKRAEEKKAQ